MSKAGRKRKFVRVEYDSLKRPQRVETDRGGTEIEGLSYDASVKSYYTRQNGKKRNLGRDLEAAIAKLKGEEPVRVKVRLSTIIPNNDDLPEEAARIVEAAKSIVLANAAGRQDMIDAATSTPAVPAKQTLSDCLQFWKDWKEEEERRPSYIEETDRVFKEFIEAVGDLPINQLAREHVVKFERWMIAESKTKKGNNWWSLRIKTVRAVLNLVEQKTDYPLPGQWRKWVSNIQTRKVVPAKEAKQRLPVDVFQAMLAACEEHAEIDVDSMPTKTNSDNGKKRQAVLKKRQGVQWQAILRLALQCSLDNQDICRIKWEHVKLHAKIPHIDFPREKVAWMTGQPVERFIPLLPSTVAALKAWKDYEMPTDLVFRTARAGEWRYDKVNGTFRKIKKDSGQNGIWSFKHLRNVAPSLRKMNHLPFDMSDAILGHVLKTGTSKFYEDEVGEEYLIPLVNVVGGEYFGGEEVNTSRTK